MVSQAYLMKNSYTGILPVVRVILLLWISPTLNGQNQGTGSVAHRAACQIQGKTDKDTYQTSCIVDLKPGDDRLFAPSGSSAGKLYRWLDLQAASVGIQYLFAKNSLGVTTANQQQYSSSTPRDASESTLDFTRAPTLSRDSIILGSAWAKRRATYISSTYISAPCRSMGSSQYQAASRVVF